MAKKPTTTAKAKPQKKFIVFVAYQQAVEVEATSEDEAAEKVAAGQGTEIGKPGPDDTIGPEEWAVEESTPELLAELKEE